MKGIKRIAKIVVDILTAFVFCVLLLVIFAKAKMLFTGNKYIELFDYSIFEVVTGSMSPTIKENDVIIVKKSDKYDVGDIITYSSENAYITHRIVSISDNFIITKGDANNTQDKAISYNDVVGKVIKIYSNFGIWKKIFSTPKILISIFATLVFFDFAFSYKGKDEKKVKSKDNAEKVIKLTDEERQEIIDEIASKILSSIDKIIVDSKNENIKSNDKNLEKTQVLDLESILEKTEILDVNEIMNELNKKEKKEESLTLYADKKFNDVELINLSDKLDKDNSFNELNDKEKDFVNKTIVLDIDDIKSKI